MPFDAWLLLAVSVGLGLGLEVAFIRARRRSTGADPRRDASASTPTSEDGA